MKTNPWKLATFLLLGIMALVLWMGLAPYQQKLSPYQPNQQNAEPKAPSNIIEAQQFVLKDSSGKVRAQLSMKDGQPRLVFYDENGMNAMTFRRRADSCRYSRNKLIDRPLAPGAIPRRVGQSA